MSTTVAALPVVIRADRAERLAATCLAILLIPVLGAAVANGAGWGVAFSGAVATGVAAAAVLLSRYRIVIDETGVHRRVLREESVPWERVAAVRMCLSAPSSGARAVAVVLEDLSALPVPITPSSSLSVAAFEDARALFAGPAAGFRLPVAPSDEEGSSGPRVLARTAWWVIGVGLLASASTALLGLSFAFIVPGEPNDSARKVIGTMVLVGMGLTCLLATIAVQRRARLVVAEHGVRVPGAPKGQTLGWNEVEAFIAIGWPGGRGWSLAAVQGPAVVQIPLPRTRFVSWHSRAEVSRLASELNLELVARRTARWEALARQCGEDLLAPKPVWMPASRRNQSLLLDGLIAGGVLLGGLAAWQGVAMGRHLDEVAARARSAPATVTRIDTSSSRGAVLRFTTDDGEHTTTQSYGANLLAVGDRIWILYDPLDPSNAWAPPHGSPHDDLRLGFVTMAGFGALAFPVTALILRTRWRRVLVNVATEKA